MEHSEFVQAWNEGQLQVDVDRAKALQLANSKILPKRYQAAHIIWSWIWLLSIPAALAVMFLYKWWLGLILILVRSMISGAAKKSAMQFMTDHSLENPGFYEFAVSQGVIRLRPKS